MHPALCSDQMLLTTPCVHCHTSAGEFVVGQQAQRRAGGQQEAQVLEVQQPQLLTQPGAAAVAVV